jgi:hypothetical protein
MKALKQTNRKKEGKVKEKAFVRGMKKPENERIEDLKNQIIKRKKIQKNQNKKEINVIDTTFTW